MIKEIYAYTTTNGAVCTNKEEAIQEEFKTNPYCKEFLIFTPTITDNKVEVGAVCAGNKVDSLKTVKDRLSTEKVVWINNEDTYYFISMLCGYKTKFDDFEGRGLYQIRPNDFTLRFIPSLISYYNSEYNQIMLYDINKYIKLVDYFDNRIANITASFKQN